MTNKDNFILEYPHLKKQWHISKNSHINPYVLPANSNRNVYWECENGHVWDAPISRRTKKGEGCPFCSNEKESIRTSLSTAKPNLVQQWHTEKNKGLTPEMVTAATRKKVWWICENGHEWKDKVVTRTTDMEDSCPMCQSLEHLRPDIVKEWHIKKNKISPTNVNATSDEKVWWKCKQGHEWKERIDFRTKNKEACCPVCQSVAYKYPDLMTEWDFNKNILNPKDLKPGYTMQVWWKCSSNHSWEETIANRTTKYTGCPQCNKSALLEKESAN